MAQKKEKILMFVADEYEDLELHYRKIRLEEGGREVVIDKNFISSRSPKDLPYFCSAILDFLSKHKLG